MIALLAALDHFQTAALEPALIAQLEHTAQTAEQVCACSVLQEPFLPPLAKSRQSHAHRALLTSLAMQDRHLVCRALLAPPFCQRLLDAHLLTTLWRKSLVFKLMESCSLQTLILLEASHIQLTNSTLLLQQ